MTDEEREYKRYEIIVDREIEMETIRLERLSFIRNLIRETDYDDRKIANIAAVEESYVRSARIVFHQLCKEVQEKRSIDFDFDHFLRNISKIRMLIRYANINAREDDLNLLVLDDDIALHVGVSPEMVRRLRNDLTSANEFVSETVVY